MRLLTFVCDPSFFLNKEQIDYVGKKRKLKGTWIYGRKQIYVEMGKIFWNYGEKNVLVVRYLINYHCLGKMKGESN